MASWLGQLTHAAQAAAQEAAKKAQDIASDLQQNAPALSQLFDELPGDEGVGATFDYFFEDGGLGFELEGARVVAIEPDGQAATLGVQLGDRLLAVAGETLPEPPSECPAAEGELKLKRLIRKKIREQPRPVRLTFISAGGRGETEVLPLVGGGPSESGLMAEDSPEASAAAAEEPLEVTALRHEGAMKPQGLDGWDVMGWERSNAEHTSEEAQAAIDGDVPSLSELVEVSGKLVDFSAVPPEEAAETRGDDVLGAFGWDDIEFDCLQTNEDQVAGEEVEEQARQKAEVEASEAAEADARSHAEEEASKDAEERARKESREEERNAAEECAGRHPGKAARKDSEERSEETQETARRTADENTGGRAGNAATEDTEEQENRAAEEVARKTTDEVARKRPKKAIEEIATKAAKADPKRQAEEAVKETREDTRSTAKGDASRQVEGEARKDLVRKSADEDQVKRHAEEEAKKKLEEAASREQAKNEADDKARVADEDQVRRHAEEKEEEEEEEEAKKQLDEAASREGAKKDADKKARVAAEDQVRRHAEEEEEANTQSEEAVSREQAKKDIDEKARAAAEEQARRAVEELHRALAEANEISAVTASALEAQRQAAEAAGFRADAAEERALLSERALQEIRVELQGLRTQFRQEITAHNAERDAHSRCEEELSGYKDQKEMALQAIREELRAQESAQAAELRAMREEARSATEGAHQDRQRQLKAIREELRAQESAQAAELRAMREEARSATEGAHQDRQRQAKALHTELEQTAARAEGMGVKAAGLEAGLARMRMDLATAQERGRRAEQQLEDSSTECEQLRRTASQRDDRVGMAQSLLENRLFGLQEQLADSRSERELVVQRASDLADEVGAARRTCEELRKVAERSGCERNELSLAVESEKQALQAELSTLRVAAAAEEQRAAWIVDEASRQCLEADARAANAEAAAEESVERAQGADRRASAADGRAVAMEAELKRLRTEDVLRLESEAISARTDADSHRQLIRILQHRLAEQEAQGEREREDREGLRCQLQELRREWETRPQVAQEHALPIEKAVAFELLIEGEDAEGDAGQRTSDASGAAGDPGRSSDGIVGMKAAPPENAGGKEALALYEQIAALERRCRSLQGKLNARPIIYQAPTDAATPLATDDVAGQGRLGSVVSSLRRRLEVLLRAFTQRLLKSDLWLLVFYAHLLVLYAIVASCLASGTSASAADCVDIHMKQATNSVPATTFTGTKVVGRPQAPWPQ